MARTLAIERMYALPGQAPPLGWQVGVSGAAASQSEVPGAIQIVVAAGYVETGTDAASGVLGILEKATTATAAAGDRYPISLILPSFLYEISAEVTGAIARANVFDLCPFITASDSMSLLDFDSTGTNDKIRILAFASDFPSFTTPGFRGKADATITAGVTTAPTEKGVDGDTGARMIVSFTSAVCAVAT